MTASRRDLIAKASIMKKQTACQWDSGTISWEMR